MSPPRMPTSTPSSDQNAKCRARSGSPCPLGSVGRSAVRLSGSQFRIAGASVTRAAPSCPAGPTCTSTEAGITVEPPAELSSATIRVVAG